MEIPTLSLCNAPDKFAIRKINTEWSNEIRANLESTKMPHQVKLPVLVNPEECDDISKVRKGLRWTVYFFYFFEIH